MAFYDTFATYTGDGTTTDYAIPFPRIDDDHIVVRVDDVVTAYTLVSTSMLRISPAPVADAIIRVQRETDVAAIEATFQNGSPIPATQINLDFRQLLYSAQESSDLRSVWFRTNGVPDEDLGKQGDWAIDESTGDLYQKISDLVWQSNLSLIGPAGTTWYSGTGAPGGGLGKVTDWYLNDANGDVYEKTAISTWTVRDNLTGPTGATGATGTGLPTGGTTSQLLVKNSNADYDFAWDDANNGDTVGPASATDNAIVRFDSTTGKLIQNSNVTIDDNGKVQFITSVAESASFNLGGGGVNPTSPVEGDMWYDVTGDLRLRRSSSNQRLAQMDQINAWGSGAQQQFYSSSSFAAIRIGPRAGDPGTLGNGDIWYNSTTAKLMARVDGTSVEFAFTGSLAPAWGDITSKPTTISGYAITDAYTDAEVDTLLSGKAATSHSHVIGDVTDLQTTLDAKAERDTVTLNTDSGVGTNLFALTDLGDVVLFTGGTAVSAEIPQESSVSWPAGARIDCIQMGAGTVTVVAGTGVTLRAQGSKVKSNGQYAAFTLIKVGTNEWVVAGNLTTV